MSNVVQTIPPANLMIAFIPVLAVIGIFVKWSLNSLKVVYAVARMLAQLLLVGYTLAFVFTSDHAGVVLGVLVIMITISSWIALGTVKKKRWQLYKYALLSIGVGGGVILVLVTQGVLMLEPWYLPRFMVPLAGMIFANSMNSVSLAAERLGAELERDVSYLDARNIAFQASLIPIMNSLFAVGLVSIPGMMTGQILAGVSPPITARYQIMVMCMVFGSAGISSACFLTLARSSFLKGKAD